MFSPLTVVVMPPEAEGDTLYRFCLLLILAATTGANVGGKQLEIIASSIYIALANYDFFS